nr:large ribosomal subunit protein uL10m-like [Pocillopora verrucosa]
MAAAMLGNRTNSVLLPFLDSITKLKLIRDHSNMALRCKSGRNKLYKVKPNIRKLMKADEIRHVFETNNMVIVCQFSDMNTAEWEDLRYTLRKDEIGVKMFPNKITCKALENTKYREILPLFLAATVVTYSREAKVKTLLTELKKQPKMGILGGKVDEKLLSRKGVVDYAKLPPLTEQYGQLLQMVTEHSRRLTTLLEQNQMNLIANLTQYVDKDEVKS